MSFSAGRRRGNRLIFGVLGDGERERVYFTVPRDFYAHNDSIAACLATLCASGYETLEFQFPISERCRTEIARRNKVTVLAREPPIAERVPGQKIALSFSGGLDSLGAYQMAPEHLIRIAVGFGGKWAPEEEFFQTLSPEVICRTNLRIRGQPNHSTFMGAAALLYSDYLDLGGIGFGEIFETRPWNYLLEPKRLKPKGFSAAGNYNATLTRGLTQLGTAQMVRFYTSEETARASIASSALPGSEKFFRKQLLVDVAAHARGGPPPDFDNYWYPKRRLRFGRRFSIDFLTLYFLKTYGFQTVSRWMDGLEKVDRAMLAEADLDWYLKYNPIFLEDLPPVLRSTAQARMSRAGIDTFADSDWPHYLAVRSFLATVHDFENK